MIYEFRCRPCVFHYVEHRAVQDRNKPSKCPKCGKPGQRILSIVPAIYRGTGFPTHDERKTPFPLNEVNEE